MKQRLIKSILNSYPRKPISLPKEYKNLYFKELKKGRSGKSIISKLVLNMEGWMHKQVVSNKNDLSYLELGCGNLNHLKYQKFFNSYDVVEPNKTYINDASNLRKNKIKNFYNTIFDIRGNKVYDRIISIAVLEHLSDLPKVLKKSNSLLKSDGLFQAGIPAEGGYFWKLASNLTTGLSFKIRTGLNYSKLMKYEHLNTAEEIITLANFFFKEVKIKYYPFNGINFSFYVYIEGKKK